MPPIDFGNQETLTRVQRLFDNPTGFGGRVRQMLTTAFGSDNVFGTAATRDAGTAGGEIPLIDSDNTLTAALGDATADRRGLSTLAALESPADVRQALVAAIDTIGGSALDIRAIPRTEVSGSRTNARFVSRLGLTDRHSLLLISAAGGNAAVSRDIFGIVRMQSVVLFPTAAAASDAVRIHINSGRPPQIVDGVINTNANFTEYRTLDGSAVETSRDCMQFLSQAQLQAFGLDWGFRLRRFGAGQGDNSDLYLTRRSGQDRYNEREFTERRDADLFIAYKPGASQMFYETNITDITRFVSTSWPFSSNSFGQAAGADGFAVEILL